MNIYLGRTFQRYVELKNPMDRSKVIAIQRLQRKLRNECSLPLLGQYEGQGSSRPPHLRKSQSTSSLPSSSPKEISVNFRSYISLDTTLIGTISGVTNIYAKNNFPTSYHMKIPKFQVNREHNWQTTDQQDESKNSVKLQRPKHESKLIHRQTHLMRFPKSFKTNGGKIQVENTIIQLLAPNR